MTWKYIIDTAKPYPGHCLNTMYEETGLVHYMKKPTTFEEYNQQHGGTLKVCSLEEIKELEGDYLKSLQKPWVKTTKQKFWEMLEVLPPRNWDRIGYFEVFYVGEPYTHYLHHCYVRLGTRYYEALRDVRSKSEDIYKELTEQLRKKKK